MQRKWAITPLAWKGHYVSCMIWPCFRKAILALNVTFPFFFIRLPEGLFHPRYFLILNSISAVSCKPRDLAEISVILGMSLMVNNWQTVVLESWAAYLNLWWMFITVGMCLQSSQKCLSTWLSVVQGKTWLTAFLKMGICAIVYFCSVNIYYFWGLVVLF